MGIADWDITAPDGQSDSLSTWDDFLREVKEDLTAWYAVEHLSNGSHSLPYLTRSLRLAYAYAQAGTMVFDSDDGYLYRYSGSAWVRVYPKGREVSYAADTTPDVADYDRILMNSIVTVTDFDNGADGQKITIKAAAAVTIEDGDHISLQGSTDFVMAAGDILTLELFEDGIWWETGRMTQA